MPAGSLAVDMFFLLSGFVISLSYDRKLAAGMKFRDFMTRRVVRLYPLYLIGFVIGALPMLWAVAHGSGWHATAIELLLGAAILPSPTWRFNPSLIPILSPAWSLFSELYVANIPFALFWKRMTTPILAAIVAISFAGLLVILRLYGTTGVGSLWSGLPGTFARVGFSFFLGVLLQRVHLRGRAPSLPTWAILLATGLSFLPRFHGLAHDVYELFCLTLMYPALIFLGAHAQAKSGVVNDILGDASYAIYVVHIPILMLIELNMGRLHLVQSRALAVEFVVCMVILSVVLARYVDIPVRRWLTERLRTQSRAFSQAHHG